MKLNTLVLAGAIALPLQQADDWQLLEYSRLKANEVTFSRDGMKIMVDKSASPIIYPLEDPMRVTSVSLTGDLSKLLNVAADSQGDEGNDDFALKLGLVIAGKKTLNPLQKMFSAKWIKTLFDLAPEGAGIEQIYFLNAVQHRNQLGRQRQHPLSELIYENNVWLLDKPGDFSFNYQLDNPQKVIAIWLSIDGDDTRSGYTTRINSLILGD
jgi:hypothetical protein